MRKCHQKPLLELIQTLDEATAVIKSLVSRGDFPAVNRLSADCRDFAVQMIKYIGTVEREGTRTASLLEEYRKDLLNISAETNGGTPGQNIAKRLRKRIISIEDSIKTELKPDKLEVVFFPYKASMWDSLESVWLAAKDDPRCDVYVVPIPYYEKAPGGASGQSGRMYYEGKLYPDYVPVVDWREYNVEKRQPDVIYIHYAYDDMTQNASVHPDFFTRNLKEHCGLLVYIPYYVQIGTDVPDYNGYLPGIINSDYVIVQSEKIRQAYIEQYDKYYQKNKHALRLDKPEDKFVALGSPKFDKVLNSKKEDFELPEEWKRMIFRADGTAKKVMLYNTHMFSWISGGETYFKKIRSVFESLRENDDAVLWWRPHPNTELNFRTLRPQLLSEYKHTVEEYKRGGFGIYDDTPDIHRAITLSDYLYSDPTSSLIALYAVAGKPIVMQRKGDDTYKLSFDNLYSNGENLWFTAIDCKALFKMNKHTLEMEYIGNFDNNAFDAWKPYYEITRCDSKLYFTPLWAREIGIYDTAEKCFESISIAEQKSKKESTPNFYMAATYNKYVFMAGYNYPAIIRINTENNDINYFTDWVAPLTQAKNNDDAYLSRGCVLNNRMFIASCSANVVLEFDMNTCVSRIHYVGKKNYAYKCVCFDGRDFWLLPYKHEPIIKWNPDTGLYKEYDNFPFGFEGGDVPFSMMLYLDDHIWLFPFNANMTIKINIKNESISIAEEFINEFLTKSDENIVKCVMANVIDDNIYAFDYTAGRLIKFNPITCEKRYKSYEFSELQNFLDNHVSGKHEKSYSAKNPTDDSGNKIYDYVKKAVF